MKNPESINPGEFNRVATLQKNFNAEGTVRNEFSEPVEDWRDMYSVPAKATDSGSGEFWGKRKTYAESTILFQIRYIPAGINAAAWRIVLGEPFESAVIVKNVQKPTASQRIFNIFPPRQVGSHFRYWEIEGKEIL